MDQSFDLAVIGLGAVGGAALLAAARAGAKAVGFDRLEPPHTFGSTHGETRIVRAAIGEGEAYTPFALRSFELFDQLAGESGETLVTRCGLLVLGSALPHATHVPAGFLETTIAAAKTFGIAHEVLDASAVRARFPAYGRFNADKAYFEPGAGMAYPERVVAAQLARARALGATIRFNEPVIALARDGDGVAIRTGAGTVRAARAVLGAGAWTSTFLPEQFAKRLTVTRQTLHWFAPPAAHEDDYDPARMPVFIWNDLYGFPAAVRGGGVKVATETLDAVVRPDDARGAVSQAEIDIVLPRVRAAFPALGAHMRSAACLYTSTPDYNFWIAPHPAIENVTVVSACSGHGFKHAPAVGEAVVADLLGLAGGTAVPQAWNELRGPM